LENLEHERGYGNGTTVEEGGPNGNVAVALVGGGRAMARETCWAR